MVGERLVKGAVFLALIVLATGCRHKDEPLKPLVIVDKPAKVYCMGTVCISVRRRGNHRQKVLI